MTTATAGQIGNQWFGNVIFVKARGIDCRVWKKLASPENILKIESAPPLLRREPGYIVCATKSKVERMSIKQRNKTTATLAAATKRTTVPIIGRQRLPLRLVSITNPAINAAMT